MLDTSRPFISSSPSNGYENATFPIADNPQSEYYGDVHYYNYDGDCWDVSLFPRPRFARFYFYFLPPLIGCSEFGFESFPSFITLSNVSIASDWSYSSSFMLHRQHHPSGNDQVFHPLSKKSNLILVFFFFDKIINQLKKHFNVPNSADPLKNYKNTLFMTQVMQGLCIKNEAEHYRR